MCKCTPNKRTPFCGKPGCEWPFTPAGMAHNENGRLERTVVDPQMPPRPARRSFRSGYSDGRILTNPWRAEVGADFWHQSLYGSESAKAGNWIDQAYASLAQQNVGPAKNQEKQPKDFNPYPRTLILD